MNQLMTLDFESSNIRIVCDEQGIPWFNARDVCTVLGYSNSRSALARHVDAEDVAKRDTLSTGGRQQSNHVNESGLYALILGSRLDAARRFKRWVTSDVLPTLRKTSSYKQPAAVAIPPALTQDCVRAILSIGEAVAKVPGVKPGIAMAATLTAIHENTGMGIEALRKALPSARVGLGSLNPTQLGECMGLSARVVNQRLQTRGLQFKNDRDEWELTPAGAAWVEALPYARRGHAGYQILWKPEVADLISGVQS